MGFYYFVTIFPGCPRAQPIFGQCGHGRLFSRQSIWSGNCYRSIPPENRGAGIRTDSLLLAEGARRRVASVQLENLTNNVALYNFLSTFSVTHLLQPRMLVSRLGFNSQPRSTWGRFGGSQTPAGESRPGRVMQFGLRCAF